MALDLLFTRRPDWRVRLSDYLALVAPAAFRPGQHDCAMFAAGAVEAMTGKDPAADLRGTYRSLAAGQAALVAAGYADQVAFVADLFPEIPAAMAAVGDLAVMDGEGAGMALGVVQGAAVYVLRPSGLALVNRLHIQRAFRV